MADDESHLWVPDGDVHYDPITPHGGGQSYTRADYSAHGKQLQLKFQTLRGAVTRKHDAALSTDYFIQVETPKERPIRRERLKLKELGLEIVSYSSSAENKAIALIEKAKLPSLEERITRYAEQASNPGKTNLSIVEDLHDVPIEEKLEMSLSEIHGGVPSVVTLYTMLSEQEKQMVSGHIAKELLTKGKGDVQILRFVDGSIVVTANLSADEMVEIGEQYITVRSIGVDAQAIVPHATMADSLPTLLKVNAPSVSAPVVVVDTGINASSPALQNLVVESRSFLPSGATAPDYSHGTFVASRVLYADDITAQVQSGLLSPQCPVIDVGVFGRNATGNMLSPSETGLATILQTEVPDLASKARVFNLSLGLTAPSTQHSYSIITRVIDVLSREHGVLFVIAAGNIDPPSVAHPDQFLNGHSRVRPPANSLLALSVGSMAKFVDTGALSKANEVSPFSCIGPGSDNGIKPEVVAHGGNTLATWKTTPRCGVYGIASNGANLAYDCGTSYSAPLVAQYAARLFHSYPLATPNLVKGLLCHFCNEVDHPPVQNLSRENFVGFGEPVIDHALHAARGSAALIYQGSIKEDAYQSIRFYVPGCLASDVSGTQLMIRVTIVYDPPVNPDNEVEYSKCRIAAALFKNTTAGLKQVQLSGDDDYVKPWSPVIHFEKRFTRGYSTGDWELRLRLFARGVLPSGFSQSFAAIIEVLDAHGGSDVRGDILRETATRYRPIVLRVAA